MPLSLSASSGGYGMGVRPMRPVVIAARTKSNIISGFMHPSVPNGDFIITSATISVNGSDGNQSGTAIAAALIDGASQMLLSNCKVFTAGDGYCWTFVKNAANEIRLVRASFNGSITTPGVKFSPAAAGSFTNQSFCYESGNNIIVRSNYANNLYQFTVSKLTGALINEVVLVSNNTLKSQGTYITADGRVTFSSLRKISAENEYSYISLHTFDGTVFPIFYMYDCEIFGARLTAAAHWFPVVAGDYIQFSTDSGQMDFKIFRRSEFDRWLLDVAKKFELV